MNVNDIIIDIHCIVYIKSKLALINIYRGYHTIISGIADNLYIFVVIKIRASEKMFRRRFVDVHYGGDIPT